MSDPIALVERGYDTIAQAYADWGESTGSPREAFLQELLTRLPAGAPVLELGCGAGIDLERLAERFDVTGVDLSREQLRRAEQRVPQARLVHGDATTLELEPGSFAGVVSFFVLGHVPRERHATLYRLVAEWLSPGGVFVANMAIGNEAASVDENWLGAPMFFSSWDPPTNRRLLAEAGFALARDELVTTVEPDGAESTFQWVVARR